MTPKLVDRLRARLSSELRAAFDCAVAEATRRGIGVYLVGGAVRDLLLGVEHVDIDLVTEGDAIALAETLAKQLRARVVAHPRFGTAVVQGEGFRLDLARARAERYERPGALPSVTTASLADDLARRDFSINAMALRLTEPAAGELIDPHGGKRDLARRRIRVLHDGSFRDDATRILRALRYAGRLGFELDEGTAAVLRRDLRFIDTIGGARLRREFEQIAREANVVDIVAAAERLGVLAAVHPAERARDRALSGLGQVAASHRDAVLFCVLLAEAGAPDAEAAARRLALTGAQTAALRGMLVLRAAADKLSKPSLLASETVAIFEPVPVAAAEAFALTTRDALAADRARRYVETWRHVRPRLNGRDLAALGVPFGPQVGVMLVELRAARLDGRAATRQDEEELVRTTLARGRDPSSVSRG